MLMKTKLIRFWDFRLSKLSTVLSTVCIIFVLAFLAGQMSRQAQNKLFYLAEYSHGVSDFGSKLAYTGPCMNNCKQIYTTCTISKTTGKQTCTLDTKAYNYCVQYEC